MMNPTGKKQAGAQLFPLPICSAFPATVGSFAF